MRNDETRLTVPHGLMNLGRTANEMKAYKKYRPEVRTVTSEERSKHPRFWDLVRTVHNGYRGSFIKRKCLCCTQEFHSYDVGNRVCPNCTKANRHVGIRGYHSSPPPPLESTSYSNFSKKETVSQSTRKEKV